MRSILRQVLRLSALLILMAVLFGVPVAVARTVGLPAPSGHAWHQAFESRRVDTDFVVRLGAGVFVLLWLWFAITALAEFCRVWPRRREPASLPVVSRADGPGWWVRSLVRFVAVSSVSAGALMSGFGAVHGAAPVNAPQHVVVLGDSYWRIAEHQLLADGAAPSPHEVMVLTDELVAANAPRLGHRDPTLLVPGEVVQFPSATPVDAAPTAPTPRSDSPEVQPVAPQPGVVTTTPPPTPPVSTTSVPTTVPVTTTPPLAATPTTGPVGAPEVLADSGKSDHTAVVTLGLAAAALLAGGAVRAIDARRRRGWRAASVSANAVAPSFDQVRTELLLRTVDAEEQLARLDVVLRSVSRDLAAQGAAVLAVTENEHGDVRLFLRGSATPSDRRWRLQPETGSWFLPGSVSMESLAEAARAGVMACPALLHLGTTDDGCQVFADVEAMGVLAIHSSEAPAIVRAAVAAFMVSPFVETSLVLASGLDELPDGVEQVHPEDAVAAALASAAGVVIDSRGTSTFALRAQLDGSESWPPVLLLSAESVELEAVIEIGGGHGLGVLAVDASDASFVLRADAADHVLEPFGLRLQPIGIEAAELAAVVDVLVAAEHEVATAVGVDLPTWASVFDDDALGEIAEWMEPRWDLMVKVLGNLDVVTRLGESVHFERSKSLELVAWLSQHRERPTRSGARAALWDVAVRDATFANVVSDARRAMGRAVPPPEGEEWIARTLTEDLPLHPKVVTDAEVLRSRVLAARRMSAQDAVAVLRPGVAALSGLPFGDAAFLWTDAEGHTTSLVLLATGAAIELANHYLVQGDIDGVFWATGQGLKVLPGHEELIALRMRAHAARGDLTGVRQEWESYERALAAEPWASNDPAPKLMALRRELLTTPVSSARH